jgi:hypothetical protein
MLYGEVIALFSQIQTKRVDGTFEFFNVKPGGT